MTKMFVHEKPVYHDCLLIVMCSQMGGWSNDGRHIQEAMIFSNSKCKEHFEKYYLTEAGSRFGVGRRAGLTEELPEGCEVVPVVLAKKIHPDGTHDFVYEEAKNVTWMVDTYDPTSGRNLRQTDASRENKGDWRAVPEDPKPVSEDPKPVPEDPKPVSEDPKPVSEDQRQEYQRPPPTRTEQLEIIINDEREEEAIIIPDDPPSPVIGEDQFMQYADLNHWSAHHAELDADRTLARLTKRKGTECAQNQPSGTTSSTEPGPGDPEQDEEVDSDATEDDGWAGGWENEDFELAGTEKGKETLEKSEVEEHYQDLASLRREVQVTRQKAVGQWATDLYLPKGHALHLPIGTAVKIKVRWTVHMS